MSDLSRIFNKSFNDLTFLQNIESTENMNKFVFVFDFDMTLTTISSNGIDINSNYTILFGSNEKLLMLKKLFEKITSINNIIYINTRAIVSNINIILKNVGIDNLVKKIFGSKNVENINNPFTKLELENYNLKNINNSDILWAIKKVIFLNEIKEIENICESNILFFDDIPLNINTAKLNGYINSFLIGSNDSGLYGLDYLLIKLEQIMMILNQSN
jgi:hypothetical protein